MDKEQIICELERIRDLADKAKLNQKLSVWEVEINWLLDKELNGR